MSTLQPLFQKEVSRKEFISIVGLSMASAFGMSSIIKLLTGRKVSTFSKRSTSGYSSSDYGGKKAASRL